MFYMLRGDEIKCVIFGRGDTKCFIWWGKRLSVDVGVGSELSVYTWG